MTLPEPLERWLEQAAAQIRWKRARPAVSRELRDHMEDQYADLCAQDAAPEEAARRTVEEMGDPVTVGTALDRAWRPTPDWTLLGLALVVSLAGAVLQYWAIMGAPEEIPFVWSVQNSGRLPLRLLTHYLLGAGALLVGYFADHTLLARHWKAVCIGYAALYVAVAWCGPVYNARVYHMQYVLLFAPLVNVSVLYRLRGCGLRGVLGGVLAAFALMALAFAQAFLWLGLLILTVCLLTLLCAVRSGAFGTRKGVGTALALGGFAACALAALMGVLTRAHWRERLLLLIDPRTDYLGAGWQMTCVRGTLYRGYLPEEWNTVTAQFIDGNAWSDLLLVWLKLHWGWAAFAAVVLLAAALCVRLAVVARRQSGLLGRLTALSVTLLFVLESALYIAGNLGGVQTGVLMPLLSYGLCAQVIHMMLLGLALSVARTGRLYTDNGTEERVVPVCGFAKRLHRAVQAFGRELAAKE